MLKIRGMKLPLFSYKLIMIFKFNTAKSVSYAYSYMKRQNPFYIVFDEQKEGVSFISQCLLAGCENLNAKSCPNWFYENENKYSDSWVDGDELLKYLLNQNQCGAKGRIVSRTLLSVGDIVFFETKNAKQGVGIVTKICENEIFFVSKGVLQGEKSLDKSGFLNEKFIHIIGVKK